MKHIHTFESFLNENLNEKVGIEYKKVNNGLAITTG